MTCVTSTFVFIIQQEVCSAPSRQCREGKGKKQTPRTSNQPSKMLNLAPPPSDSTSKPSHPASHKAHM
ncbi:hypothetical protein BDY21DRAFT_338758, partial [Lineolata rhizophorae]